MRKLIGLYLLKNYRFSYCDCLPFLNEIGVLTLTIHEILLLFLVSYLLLGYVPYGENKKKNKKKKKTGVKDCCFLHFFSLLNPWLIV